MAGGGFFYGGLAVMAIALLAGQVRLAEAPSVPIKRAPLVVEAPEPTPPPPMVGGLGAVTLVRAADGHFYADAQVNGAAVRFLVDTGSSAVVLSAADAARIGLGAGDYSREARGAGGTVKLLPVTLNRLALGTLAADNVPAMVAERDALPVSLLGQSWLSRVGSVTIERDRMVLR